MEESKILIKINEVKEISFILKPIPISIDQVELGKNLSINIGFGFNILSEKEILELKSSVAYRIKGVEKPVLELEDEIIFSVTNLSSVVKENDKGQPKIVDSFTETLIGISLGTTRGMLAANTKGSDLSKFPLPLFNPKNILKNSSVEIEKDPIG